MALVALLAFAVAGPAAAYSRIFLCFFELDSAVLTVRGRQVADTAAVLWQRLRDGEEHSYLDPAGPPIPAATPHLDVIGYAQDASGDNEALSLARAEAVAAELRARGVPGEDVTPIGRGARDPFVPDAPLDPQNRRVWIVFR